MATHYSILAWRIPWTEEPGRLQSIVSQRIEHDWSKLACIQTYSAIVKEDQTTFQNWWDILRRLILILLTLWVPGNILSNWRSSWGGDSLRRDPARMHCPWAMRAQWWGHCSCFFEQVGPSEGGSSGHGLTRPFLRTTLYIHIWGLSFFWNFLLFFHLLVCASCSMQDF